MVSTTTTTITKAKAEFTPYVGCQEDDIVYAYTASEARKVPLPASQMPPLFDEPTTLKNFHRHVNWLQSLLLVSTPLIAFYGAWTTPLTTKTLYWTLIYYFVTGLGITGGYHRLWAHRSYHAPMITQLFFCLAGSGAVEGKKKESKQFLHGRGHF